MPKYKLNVTLTTKGTVEIEADNITEAKRICDEDFGAMLGSTHTSNDDAVIDWDFDSHLEQKITKVRRVHRDKQR